MIFNNINDLIKFVIIILTLEVCMKVVRNEHSYLTSLKNEVKTTGVGKKSQTSSIAQSKISSLLPKNEILPQHVSNKTYNEIPDVLKHYHFYTQPVSVHEGITHTANKALDSKVKVLDSKVLDSVVDYHTLGVDPTQKRPSWELFKGFFSGLFITKMKTQAEEISVTAQTLIAYSQQIASDKPLEFHEYAEYNENISKFGRLISAEVSTKQEILDKMPPDNPNRDILACQIGMLSIVKDQLNDFYVFSSGPFSYTGNELKDIQQQTIGQGGRFFQNLAEGKVEYLRLKAVKFRKKDKAPRLSVENQTNLLTKIEKFKTDGDLPKTFLVSINNQVVEYCVARTDNGTVIQPLDDYKKRALSGIYLGNGHGESLKFDHISANHIKSILAALEEGRFDCPKSIDRGNKEVENSKPLQDSQKVPKSIVEAVFNRTLKDLNEKMLVKEAYAFTLEGKQYYVSKGNDAQLHFFDDKGNEFSHSQLKDPLKFIPPLMILFKKDIAESNIVRVKQALDHFLKKGERVLESDGSISNSISLSSSPSHGSHHSIKTVRLNKKDEYVIDFGKKEEVTLSLTISISEEGFSSRRGNSLSRVPIKVVNSSDGKDYNWDYERSKLDDLESGLFDFLNSGKYKVS